MKQDYSVLMSVYYKEKPEYLKVSIESMLNQTVKTNDFVLVCDGPLTPELDEVIYGFEKDNKNIFNVVRLDENHGLGNALSIGIKKCKNDLVARMDSDDISKIDRCENQLKMFNELDVDVVGTNITEYDENMEKIISSRVVPEKDQDIKKFAKKRNPMNHVTVMYKKSAVISSGNYMDMIYFEDYFLWSRMIKNNCKFYNIQEKLVNVRGGDSMIQRRGGKSYISCIIKFEKAIRKIKLINYFEYLFNVITRIIVSMIPNASRSLVYKKVLRREKQYG